MKSCLNQTLVLTSLLALLTLERSAQAQMMTAAGHYEGRWELQPNGDVKVIRTYKLPMLMYNNWKANDIHMIEARAFAGDRSPVEVTGQKAEWDDLNRSLILTMMVLGLGQNKGDHWEAKMLPHLEFSNLDETHKIAYFHFSTQSEMGRVEGQDLIILPTTCTKASWDNVRKTVLYALPPPAPVRAAGPFATRSLWWILAGVSWVVGLGLTVVSFVIKPQPSSTPDIPVKA